MMNDYAKKLTVCALLLVIQMPGAMAQGFIEKLGKDINRGAIDAGKAIEKGTSDTGHAIEQGAHDAGKAIEKGTSDAGNAIEQGAHDTGNAIEKAVHDIGYALTVHPSDAKPNYPPYYVPLQAECPSASNTTSWQTYLSKPTKQYVVVGVQFRFAKDLEPPRALVAIDPAACYAVTFDPQKGFGGHRTFGYSRMYSPEYNDLHQRDGGLPGDPNRYQINVDGTLLLYNEAGEIYDHRGRVAGTMVCYLSNACEQYKY
jgi:hypothetical protein